RLPPVWADYDPGKKRFAKMPQLPPEPAPAAKTTHEALKPPNQAPGAEQGASPGISAEQWDQLRVACEVRRSAKRRLLAPLGVSLPRQLPAARFREALALLESPNSALL